jgi:putative NADPH-quinone reductase
MLEDDKKQIHIKLDAALHQALKLEAAYCNTTVQDLVVEIIADRITKSTFNEFIKKVKEL